MEQATTFVDTHCHILPGFDDGPRRWEEAVTMGKIAAAEGLAAVFATPEQRGAFEHNTSDDIRQRCVQLNDRLRNESISLRVVAGARLAVTDDLATSLSNTTCLTLGDHKRHALLNVPMQTPMKTLAILEEVSQSGVVPIWSSVDRSFAIAENRRLLTKITSSGCLLQITAPGLLGEFGQERQRFAEWLLENDLASLVATAARGAHSRRPLMQRAFERVRQLTCDEVAVALCCDNPRAIAEGRALAELPTWSRPRTRRWWPWRRAA